MLNPFTFLPLTFDKCPAISGTRLRIRWMPSDFAFWPFLLAPRNFVLSPPHEWEFMCGPCSAVKILHEFAYFREHKGRPHLATKKKKKKVNKYRPNSLEELGENSVSGLLLLNFTRQILHKSLFSQCEGKCLLWKMYCVLSGSIGFWIGLRGCPCLATGPNGKQTRNDSFELPLNQT